MLITAIFAFLGALLSILASIGIEYQRKPKLHFEIEDPPTEGFYSSGSVKKARFVRVLLCNKAMPRLLKWLGRNPALQCSGHIQFYHIADGAPILSSAMPIRWAGAEEPFTLQTIENGEPKQVFDVAKYHAASFRNCFPGTKEIIDVAVRFDNEDICYGWSNESYLKDWKNPDWKLSSGRYFVKVTVTCAGELDSGVFKLENSAGMQNFRLTKASHDEASNLK